MRTVFVLFDTLNRKALGAYGAPDGATPNFDRFSRRAVTCDRHYVGSLPCMPARRDIHTGRLGFMHRSWGPLEPFDNSFAHCLGKAGVYTHLITDHDHYFEDGGSGYVTKYDTWDYIRGQASDKWAPVVAPPIDRYRETYDDRHYELGRLPDDTATLTEGNSPYVAWRSLQTIKNREAYAEDESAYPSKKCFDAGLRFLDDNRDADNWFLQIETFDPHEPFVAPQRFRDKTAAYNGKVLDYPKYLKVQENESEIDEIRGNYKSLVAFCDDSFGLLLDYFDAHDLWRDTALLVTTDHGFLLGEHDWWGKNRMPHYEEISHIPLMIWHPKMADANQGTRCDSLTQTPDLMPTFLRLHGCPVPPEVTGEDITPKLTGETDGRDGVILGMFGGPVCVTDGRYTYFRYPWNVDGDGINEYTLMPCHMAVPFQPEELRDATLSLPFDFTKGIPLLKIPARKDAKRPPSRHGVKFPDTTSEMFDLDTDPAQISPIEDAAVLARLEGILTRAFGRHDAPPEMFDYYELQS